MGFKPLLLVKLCGHVSAFHMPTLTYNRVNNVITKRNTIYNTILLVSTSAIHMKPGIDRIFNSEHFSFIHNVLDLLKYIYALLHIRINQGIFFLKKLFFSQTSLLCWCFFTYDWLIDCLILATNISCKIRTGTSSTIYKIYRNDGAVRQPWPPRETLHGRTRLLGRPGTGWDFYKNWEFKVQLNHWLQC